MNCQTAQEMVLAARLAGDAAPDEASAHARNCPACTEEIRRLTDTWAALAALPLLAPSPRVSRRLRRRIRWESARETVASVESWQRAALVGVGGFVLSFVLSLLVPYETMVALCQGIAPQVMPSPSAYLAAGSLYGLVPMVIVAAVQGGPPAALAGLVGVLEAAVVFLMVVIPYVVVACGFPPPLLVGFVGGMGLGALAGGAAAMTLRHRIAWA